MNCPKCTGEMVRDGKDKGRQRWRCNNSACPVKTHLEGIQPKDQPKSSTDRWRAWRDRNPDAKRPYKQAKRKKDEAHTTTTFRFEAELMQALRDRASKDGTSRNQVVIEALKRYLKN